MVNWTYVHKVSLCKNKLFQLYFPFTRIERIEIYFFIVGTFLLHQ